MALNDPELKRLVLLAATLFPTDAEERLSLMRVILLREFDPKACEAVIRRHATRNKFVDFPKLTEELSAANENRGAVVKAVLNQAAEEMERRRKRDAQQRAAADADFKRVDELVGGADPADVAEAARRVVERMPHLATFVKRGVESSPTLKSLVAAELAGCSDV